MTIAGIPTRRPARSSPDIEPEQADPIGELASLVGQVMAGQVALSGKLERELGAFRTEHETYTRTVLALHKDVTELLSLQRIHGRAVKRAAKAMPAALAVVELLRFLFEHFNH